MTFQRPTRAPDWADTVAGPQSDPNLTARAAFTEALAQPPKWLGAAMALRNLVVAPFGLKRAIEGEGPFLGRMPVVADTPDHFETGIDDRHLTFTLAVRRGNGRLGVTTAIWFNSWIGRVYLRVVMPGHILATRHMAGRVAGPLVRTHGEFLERSEA